MANTVVPLPTAGSAPSDEQINRYIDAVAATMPQKVQDALAKVKPKTRLLALQRYARVSAQGELEKRWVWDERQIYEFEHSAKGRAVREAAAKVKEQFQTANPGYGLEASPIRNLQRQADKWNHNPRLDESVKEVAARTSREITRYPDMPDQQSLARFRDFLAAMELDHANTSAAPGLSDHGQMHAIDFVVTQGDETIAGTNSGHAAHIEWDAKWKGALRTAVVAADAGFNPQHLTSPYEPWHYKLVGGH